MRDSAKEVDEGFVRKCQSKDGRHRDGSREDPSAQEAAWLPGCTSVCHWGRLLKK